ncbi:hypothetical protein AVEN_134912-1 [Araneus ventricosus]|uniref:Homeobox domain-containing protein n=1 Tax=Araneus ventricosus TaxID=182803 RepID=A0A4Y2CK77_ARAVE|nr:hypothetical protein AVEN_134912-1 [Araneus ventricosus]
MANVSDEMQPTSRERKKAFGKSHNTVPHKPSKRKKEPKANPQPDGNNNKIPPVGSVADTEPGSLSNISPPGSLNGNSNCSSILLGDSKIAAGSTSDPESGDKAKRKKARTTFTGRQIFELEKQFEIKKYLSSSERADMAKLLNVTETQVVYFFISISKTALSKKRRRRHL